MWCWLNEGKLFKAIALSGIHEGTGAELKYWSNFQLYWPWNNKDHSLISTITKFQRVWEKIDWVVSFQKSQKLQNVWRARRASQSLHEFRKGQLFDRCDLAILCKFYCCSINTILCYFIISVSRINYLHSSWKSLRKPFLEKSTNWNLEILRIREVTRWIYGQYIRLQEQLYKSPKSVFSSYSQKIISATLYKMFIWFSTRLSPSNQPLDLVEVAWESICR